MFIPCHRKYNLICRKTIAYSSESHRINSRSDWPSKREYLYMYTYMCSGIQFGNNEANDISTSCKIAQAAKRRVGLGIIAKYNVQVML